MTLRTAVLAAAPDAPADVLDALEAASGALAAIGVLKTRRRLAALIGQTAHESLGYRHREERLWYSARRLVAVWPSRFASVAAARPFARDPRALAERVYGGRLGNDRPGDGWRYRGRGWLMLTGRANYRRTGAALGVDLESRPERAAEPAIAWQVAGHFLATRRRGGRTALEWADRDAMVQVTRIVNGGTHGAAERARLTRAVLATLSGNPLRPTLRQGDRGAHVVALQTALLAKGFPPGPADGLFGPRTAAALRAFQADQRLEADGVAGFKSWSALEPVSGTGVAFRMTPALSSHVR